MTRSYATGAAFRTALETRLRSVAQERGVQIQGLRLKVAIERMLSRLFRDPEPPWLLKGGYALELRFRPRARSTRDMDLTLRNSVEEGPVVRNISAVHEAVMNAARCEFGDFFDFVIPPPRHELTVAPGGGGTFSVIAKVAGSEFARFRIDIGFGDAVLGEPDRLSGEDLLSFAHIPAPVVLAIPKAQHFAEKIHAYTFPWSDRENTRSRDLVDIVLLIERGGLDLDAVRIALAETFTQRRRHRIPASLAPPPHAWAAEFPAMAEEAGISTAVIEEAFMVLTAFWGRLQPLA
jgi:hypothetical protein